MKKIINGKLYDTGTATKLAVRPWTGSWNDLDYIVETLYRKKTGEYFLHGEGGPATRYAQATGTNSWSGGERIMPLGYDDAREWAEKYMAADDYQKNFGTVEDDDTKRAATYSLSVGAVDKLRRKAEQAGVSASEMLERLIAEL